ncbi:MAG: MDR family MFS transporter [Sciscionella sp.]
MQRQHRGAVLVALMLTMALAAMDTTIVATAIPQVVSDLGGFSSFTWVFSAYLLAQTVTIPVYGKLADLYGRKPVLLVGAVIFLVGSAACAASPGMLALILFRVLQGLGAGSIQATVSTLAGDLYSLAERGRVQGWLSSVWGIAAVAGPTLGGAFAQYASWRWIFLVNLPIGAVAITLILRYLHEDVQRRRHRIDYAGAALVLLAAVALFLGLLQGGTSWSWLSTPSVAVFAAAAAFAVAAFMVERRAAEPIMPPWVWRRRVLTGSNLAMLGLGLLVIGPSTFLPTYAQSLLGLGPIEAGLTLATMSIGWPLCSALSPKLYLRIGFRDTALLGALLCVAATIGYALLPDGGHLWQLVLATLVLGAGFGLLSTPIVVGIQSGVGWAARGVVTGTSMFCRYLGQGLGAAVFGAVANTTMANRLAAAPPSLRGRVPADVNAVAGALGHRSGRATPEGDFLRQVLYAGTHHVFLGLVAVAAVTVVILIRVTPRHFPVTPEQRVTAGKR